MLLARLLQCTVVGRLRVVSMRYQELQELPSWLDFAFSPPISEPLGSRGPGGSDVVYKEAVLTKV